MCFATTPIPPTDVPYAHARRLCGGIARIPAYVDRDTNSHTDRHANSRTHRDANSHTDRHANSRTDRDANSRIDRHANSRTDRDTDSHTDRHAMPAQALNEDGNTTYSSAETRRR